MGVMGLRLRNILLVLAAAEVAQVQQVLGVLAEQVDVGQGAVVVVLRWVLPQVQVEQAAADISSRSRHIDHFALDTLNGGFAY